jgi:photosystem II stability/assembly factor-like uncharacterized protein
MKIAGGSRTVRVAGVRQLPGKVHYFIGNDATKWQTNVPTYAALEYKQIYPGVDMTFYGSQGRLEYDFIVAPGADPRSIRLRFAGAGAIRLDRNGDLVLKTAVGEVRQQKPVVYQERGGERQEVAGRYSLRGRREVAFTLGPYDRNKQLVIDPVIGFATYISVPGGSAVRGVALDSEGAIYVTGTNYVGLPGGAQRCPAYAFVTKLNASATAVVYSTFVGGGNQCNDGNAIAVDATGAAYLTGSTNSKDFPTTPSAFQASFGGSVSAFITKLSPGGESLVYSSFLGGPTMQGGFGPNNTQARNVGRAIALDHFGNAYLTGDTDASDFPTVNPVQPRNTGGLCIQGDIAFSCAQEAFVAKVNSAGTALIYSTYLGGAGVDLGTGIAVDSTGSIYVAGSTSSGGFPTVNPIQPRLKGLSDAFITKISPDGKAILYSTYLGGNGNDFARGLAVDSSGSSYLTGGTSSSDFPATQGALQIESADSSLFRSTDGGDSWKTIGRVIPYTDVTTESVVFDSVNPSTMFVSTQAGLFKSTDGGVSSKSVTGYIESLAISSTSPATLYGTTFVVPLPGTRIIRSTDGGETWRLVPSSLDSEYISALAVDPLDPMTAYASLERFASIFKTTDGGESWRQHGDDVSPSGAIIFDPVDPATLYAVSPGVSRSTDGGRRWRRSVKGLTSTVFGIAIDPRSHHAIYAGTGTGVFKSLNGGRSWEPTSLSQIAGAVAVDTRSGTVYAGSGSFDSNGRIFRSIDGGQSWKATGNGLPARPISTLVIDPRNPETLYAGTSGGGSDAFVARLDAGGALVYATYLGGPGADIGNAIAVDDQGNVQVAGQTESRLFPNRNAPQFESGLNARTFEGDAFAIKLNPQGTTIVYSTYLGGSFADQGLGIAIASGGRAIIVGSTSSNDFPTRNPIQGPGGGLPQGFVVSLADLVPGSPPPLVTAVTPGIGSTLGGDTVVISGANFAADAAVTIIGFPATRVERVDSATLRVTTGGGIPGRGKVRVTNPDGQNDTLIGGFGYVLPPVISSVEIKARNLQVLGSNFDIGSTIILDGEDVETGNDEDSPAAKLILRKANKKIERGQTVIVRVRNPDGILSRAVSYTRPE